MKPISNDLQQLIDEANSLLLQNNLKSLKLYEEMIRTGYSKEDAQKRSGYITNEQLRILIHEVITEAEKGGKIK